ncbi:MAG: radical SAM protein [Lachnospiraceae bacterium]|nr:radical SAM protein [Lachnospiraceae bacterium]
MKICKRAIDTVQVIDEDGTVRLCGWQKDGGVIGRLTENSMEEIYNSHAANVIRNRHFQGDYSNCNPNACPYVANDNVDSISIDIEKVPKTPSSLLLAFENVCNYRCVMCTIPDCMKKANAQEREKKYEVIEKELKKVLPGVTFLSANGLGELFVSKHTLKLLSEWRPVSDPKDITVGLETNGSLFDKAHWEQIENLGQYNLRVFITILSFKDELYRELSGTKESIDRLIDNLHFVKELRRKGIINYLELATVYQERNFRELPSFAERCINEFNADQVRLRPFEPWGETGMKEWFMDVRNAYHPYHNEFLKIMEEPILKHPKVFDWGGGKESGLGPEPYIKTRRRMKAIDVVFSDEFENILEQKIGNKDVVIYGMGVVGKALVSRLRYSHNIPYVIDRNMNGEHYDGIKIYGINQLEGLNKAVSVVISINEIKNQIIELLKSEGYEGEIISIEDLA